MAGQLKTIHYAEWLIHIGLWDTADITYGDINWPLVMIRWPGYWDIT